MRAFPTHDGRGFPIDLNRGFPSIGGGVPGPEQDPFFSSVVLLTHFDGADAATATSDDSGSAHVISFTGNAQLDTAQSKFGGSSLLLDGTGDTLTIPDHADWHFGTGEFTIEGFTRFNTVDNMRMMSHSWLTTGNLGWTLGRDPDGNLQLIYSTNGTNAFFHDGAWSPATNTWYHFAVDRDASDILRSYIDGTMVHTADISANNNFFNGTDKLIIGNDETSPRELDGWLEEMRITKGVARYQGNFTVPLEAYPNS